MRERWVGLGDQHGVRGVRLALRRLSLPAEAILFELFLPLPLGTFLGVLPLRRLPLLLFVPRLADEANAASNGCADGSTTPSARDRADGGPERRASQGALEDPGGG
jgi:hypothetical protein